MNKNLLLASGAAMVLLVTGCASGPKHEAPAPAPTPKSYTVKGVNFAFDSYKLTPAGEAILDEAAAGMKAASGHTFNVVGHTDSKGSDAYNMGLGQRRANTVTNGLAKRGVPASQMATSSMGERQPVATNETEAGRAENRRVEIFPVKK